MGRDMQQPYARTLSWGPDPKGKGQMNVAMNPIFSFFGYLGRARSVNASAESGRDVGRERITRTELQKLFDLNNVCTFDRSTDLESTERHERESLAMIRKAMYEAD